jgi:hypothetical protein
MCRAVEQAASDWDEAGRPVSRLWERGQLAAAVNDTGAHLRPPTRASGQPPAGTPSWRERLPGWLPRGDRTLATGKVELSQRARAFLHTNIRLDRRRRRRATTVLSTLLVAAIAVAGVAVTQQRAAQRQQPAAQFQQRMAIAHGLVTQADAAPRQRSSHRAAAAVAANAIHLDGETQAGLVSTLIGTRWAATLPGGSPVHTLAVAPNGQLLAAGMIVPSCGRGLRRPRTRWGASSPSRLSSRRTRFPLTRTPCSRRSRARTLG